MDSYSNQDFERWFADEVLPHEPSLRSYLRQTLPSPADVDDVVQTTYASLLAAKRNDAVRSTKGLLFTIARYSVCEFFARRNKIPMEEVTETTLLPVLDEGPGLAESVCQQDELVLLAEAVKALPDRCRDVIILRKINGMSQREIAELLGISENTVESLAFKGMRRIEEFLRRRGVDRKERP